MERTVAIYQLGCSYGLINSGGANDVEHINGESVRRAGLVTRWVTVSGYTVLIVNCHSAWPSLNGIGVMHICDGYGHLYGEIGEIWALLPELRNNGLIS